MAAKSSDLKQELLKDEDADSESSSSSSESEDSTDDDSFRLSSAVPIHIPGQAAPVNQAVQSTPLPVGPKRTAKDRWAQAGQAVRTQVQVKLTLTALHGNTKKLRTMEEKKRNWFMAKLFAMLVFLAVGDTETKACAFHLTAVGMYSVDNKPYKFSYSLFVALCVFLVKLSLGPLHKWHHDREHAKHKAEKDGGHSPKKHAGHSPKKEESGDQSTGSGKTHPRGLRHSNTEKLEALREGKSFKEKVMPWALLLGFTFAEMMSTTLANYALNITPTSIYIVFKSSKMVFVAVASRFLLGAQLRKAQWCALLLLCIALLIASVAEAKPPKHGDTGGGMQGPAILLLSELFHALMLIMQQVAVQDYWPDPMLLVSSSAALGIPVTIFSMVAAHSMKTPLPPYHPVSSPMDVFVMCSNSLALSGALITHLIFHTLMDINHIVALKHMSSLSRSLCDAAKLGVMWMLGKLFWFAGAFIYGAAWKQQTGVWKTLSEEWEPNSWMMIPGLAMIGYAMLMFKFRVFVPLKYEVGEDGKKHITLHKDEKTAEEKANPFLIVDTGMDDDFYSSAFTNRRVRQTTKKHMDRVMLGFAGRRVPVNKMQAAVLKMRAADLGKPKQNDAENLLDG